ncbi:MAG: hypothetical protein EP330_04480 [Deltaproteobacteria bacterium]|nr:MAG: hypothetical protein EP330_04480 [Deltaproteobacteria bacterium]
MHRTPVVQSDTVHRIASRLAVEVLGEVERHAPRFLEEVLVSSPERQDELRAVLSACLFDLNIDGVDVRVHAGDELKLVECRFAPVRS